MDLMDRFARQTGLVPRSVLEELPVTVIGVGAIGRQLALQLAALGVESLTLIDFDQVELTNITTQGYLAEDQGLAKVHAAGKAVLKINPLLHLELIEARFRPQLPLGDAVFC